MFNPLKEVINELDTRNLAAVNNIQNPYLRGGARGLRNIGYGALNTAANLVSMASPMGTMDTIASIPQQIKNAPNTVKSISQGIKRNVDYYTNPQKIKEDPSKLVSDGVEMLAGFAPVVGVIGKANKVTKVVPKINTTPNIPVVKSNTTTGNFVKPKISEVKSGVTADMLTKKNSEYRKNLSPERLHANVESNYIGGDPQKIANEYLTNTRRNVTNLAFVDDAGNIHNPYGAYNTASKEVLLSPQATRGTAIHENAHAILYRMMDAANRGDQGAIRFLNEVRDASGRGAEGNEAFAYGAQWSQDPYFAPDLNLLYKYGFSPEDAMNTGVLTERLYGYRR